jgi:hypothetical protein
MSLNAAFCLACAVGIAAHVCIFIRGEWHMQAPALFVFHALCGLLVVFSVVRHQELLPSSLAASCKIIGGYLIGLFASIIGYRLSPLHRLSKFQGPRLAAVSKLWHVWQCRDSRNHELMCRLHEKYGDFARTGAVKTSSQRERR